MKRVAISLAALLATTGCVFAQAPKDSNSAPPSAKSVAPGQTQRDGGTAKDRAPGQTKDEGASAKSEAPGQKKTEGTATDTTRQPGSRTKQVDKSDGKNQNERSSTSKSSSSPASKSDGQRTDKNTTTKSAGGEIKLKAEQKTKVATIFEKHKVAPATNVSVNVSVGTVVPRKVKLYAIPSDILVVAPVYRGYRYFIIDGRVVIVQPSTYRIVDVIVLA